MESPRFHFQVDIPELSEFEVTVLKRLKSAAPEPLSYEELCPACTPRNLGYLNRLRVTELTMQFPSEAQELFMCLTDVGEQALAALDAGPTRVLWGGQ